MFYIYYIDEIYQPKFKGLLEGDRGVGGPCVKSIMKSFQDALVGLCEVGNDRGLDKLQYCVNSMKDTIKQIKPIPESNWGTCKDEAGFITNYYEYQTNGGNDPLSKAINNIASWNESHMAL